MFNEATRDFSGLNEHETLRLSLLEYSWRKIGPDIVIIGNKQKIRYN